MTLGALRIIVISIAISTVCICMLFLGLRGIDPGDSMIMSLIFAATSFPATTAAFLVPNLVAKTQLDKLSNNSPETGTDEKTKDQQLMQIFGTRIIVGVALLESGAVLNALAFFMEGHLFSLVVAAVCAGLCLVHFPTQFAYDQWREKVLR
jgi:hypothetical protein